MKSFGVFPRGYQLFGSFSACHLAPFCRIDHIILLYVSLSRNFDSKLFCWSYGWIFSGYKLLFIQIISTIAIWQFMPEEDLYFSLWDHISIQFSLVIWSRRCKWKTLFTIKGYLRIFYSHQQNTQYKLNLMFVISVIAAAWVLCWISSFLLLSAHLSLWNANTIRD